MEEDFPVELALPNPESAISASEVPFPNGMWRQLQYYFWSAFSYAWPTIRAVLEAGVITHAPGKDWTLGRITRGTDLKRFLSYLERQGFGNHFITWVDKGEIISLRRLDSFTHQYHLKIFKNGEVRGHYECTPEAHPVRHFKGCGVEERHEDFLRFIGDWVVLKR